MYLDLFIYQELTLAFRHPWLKNIFLSQYRAPKCLVWIRPEQVLFFPDVVGKTKIWLKKLDLYFIQIKINPKTLFKNVEENKALKAAIKSALGKNMIPSLWKKHYYWSYPDYPPLQLTILGDWCFQLKGNYIFVEFLSLAKIINKTFSCFWKKFWQRLMKSNFLKINQIFKLWKGWRYKCRAKKQLFWSFHQKMIHLKSYLYKSNRFPLLSSQKVLAVHNLKYHKTFVLLYIL